MDQTARVANFVRSLNFKINFFSSSVQTFHKIKSSSNYQLNKSKIKSIEKENAYTKRTMRCHLHGPK